MLVPSAVQKFVAALPTGGLPQALVDEFFECMESYATLHEVSAIASYDPPAALGISKIRYLLFALEAHLNEFYILRERVGVLLTRFERTYRRSPIHSMLRTEVDVIRQAVEKECASIVSARGNHVHQRRHFDRASSLRRMSLDAMQHPDDHLPPNRKQWKQIKVVELRRIRQRNHCALRILKTVFVGINQVLLSPTDSIIPP